MRKRILLWMIMLWGSPLWLLWNDVQFALAQKDPVVQAPRFTVPSSLVISSGSFPLKWTSPGSFLPDRFILQQGTERDFSSAQTIYSGPDRGTYISGLPDGEFYFRVRAVTAEGSTKPAHWSSTIHRTVKHPSLVFALSLMSVGATVFLSTIVMIALGVRKTREEGG